MRIRFLTPVSNHLGQFDSDAVLEVEDAMGRDLIDRGLAEAVAGDYQASMLPDAPERATHPKARAR